MNHNPRMSSRWIGFFIWALVAASAASWGVKIFAATRPVPFGAQAPQAVAANGPMEHLFGAVVVPVAAAAPVHPESERFQLVGVIAPPSGGAGEGVAIVAIDGQPARPWHVGATLDGSTTLLAVARRTADFGPQGGPTAFSLQLPEPTAPVTGTLAPAVSQPAPQQNNPGVLPAPGVVQPVAQGNPQRENGQHVGQPLPPNVARGMVPGMMNRNGMSGRTYPPQNQGNVPPPRVAEPGQPGDLQSQIQQQQQ